MALDGAGFYGAKRLKIDGPVRAFVLAGGASTRFGADKARHEIDGVAMVVIVAQAFEGAGFPVTIIARDNRLLDYGFPILIESDRGPLHPLAGVAAGLESLQDGESALFAPCDVPFLSAAEVTSLADSVAPAIAVGLENGKNHPLIAHYCKSQLSLAREILLVEGPVMRLATEAVLVPLPEGSLSNLNYKS